MELKKRQKLYVQQVMNQRGITTVKHLCKACDVDPAIISRLLKHCKNALSFDTVEKIEAWSGIPMPKSSDYSALYDFDHVLLADVIARVMRVTDQSPVNYSYEQIGPIIASQFQIALNIKSSIVDKDSNGDFNENSNS